MPSTIRLARAPCSFTLATLVSRSPRISSTYSVSGSSSSISSRSSSMSSLDRAAKLLTKLRGLRISWAIPAVRAPSEASFSCLTTCCWVRRRLSSVSSSVSFLAWISAASFSTRFRRCTSTACWRKTSSAPAMSVSSSLPSILTWTSRSPFDMRRVARESRPIRTTSRSPKNFHPKIARAMVKSTLPMSSQKPRLIVALDRLAASWARFSASSTMFSIRATIPAVTSAVEATSSSAMAVSSSSAARVAKTPDGDPCRSSRRSTSVCRPARGPDRIRRSAPFTSPRAVSTRSLVARTTSGSVSLIAWAIRAEASFW